MAEKLNVDTIKRISELTTVKKISDLQTIPIIENVNGTYVTTQQYKNSYLLSSTYFPDNTSYGRYINYKVKISDVTYYLSTLGSEDLNSFKATFNNFINNLCKNTENSYVQLVQNQNSTDEEYSYTFKYQLSSIIPETHFPFSYNNGENSTYAYTNRLTDGIVTSYVLEEYIHETLGRILGVPSTPAYISYAIDSVIEFVDWFKGYTKDKDGLTELISTIEAKDSEINTRIDNLTTTKTVPTGNYITGITQEGGLIQSVTSKQITTSEIFGLDTALENAQLSPGRFMKKETINNQTHLSTYIDVDPTAHFDSGGVRYSLTFNDQGQIGFNSIPELTFSASGGGPYEYLSTTQTTAQITYTVNKAATVVRLDSASGTIIQSGHIINLSNTADNSHTLYAHPLDGYSDKIANVSFKFNKFKYWAFVDSHDNLTDSDVKEKNIKGTIVNGYPTSRIDFTIGSNESKYIYLLIKKKTSGSFTFKIGQDTTPGQNAGGMTQIGNDINDIYDNSIYYQLWRSTTVKTRNCNIIIS